VADDDDPWAIVDAWAYAHGLPEWYRNYGRAIRMKYLRSLQARRKEMATRVLLMSDGIEPLMTPYPIAAMLESKLALQFEIRATTRGELEMVIKLPAQLVKGNEIAPAMTLRRVLRRDLRIEVKDANL